MTKKNTDSNFVQVCVDGGFLNRALACESRKRFGPNSNHRLRIDYNLLRHFLCPDHIPDNKDALTPESVMLDYYIAHPLLPDVEFLSGEVTHYNSQKGFGFIRDLSDEESDGIFFHFTSFLQLAKPGRNQFRIPVPGDVVKFQLGKNDKGRVALGLIGSHDFRQLAQQHSDRRNFLEMVEKSGWNVNHCRPDAKNPRGRAPSVGMQISHDAGMGSNKGDSVVLVVGSPDYDFLIRRLHEDEIGVQVAGFPDAIHPELKKLLKDGEFLNLQEMLTDADSFPRLDDGNDNNDDEEPSGDNY